MSNEVIISQPALEGEADDAVLVFPASFAQRRLWFVDRFNPGSPAYNVPLHRHFRGPLNTAALERSLHEVVRRHEALRTTFSIVGGEPVQVVSRSQEVRIPVLDLSSLPRARRTAEARRRASDEASAPFDLSRGPLFRALLLKLGAQEHVLLLTMHHIVVDGWSVRVLFRELSSLYNAYAAGRASSLPDLTTQYADYAVWQRDWLRGEALAQQLRYWRRQLDGIPALELPTDRPRPRVQTFNGGSQAVWVPEAVAAGLKALARQEGATSFMVLLSAFIVLLHRYTGQTDLAVGIPVAGRSQRELEDLIGFFVNTLVLRTNVGGAPGFRELIRRVRDTSLDAFSHQDLPFEKLVEELCPTRDVSRPALFQAMFILQNAASERQRFDGLTCRRFRAKKMSAKFDLTLAMSERRGRLRARFVYNADMFEAVTIKRIADNFRTLLKAAAEYPDVPVGTLPLVSPEEREQLVVRWNRTETEYPATWCVHELFKAQAARTPDAIALVHEPLGAGSPSGVERIGGAHLTYGELDTRSNQLAHVLHDLGVQQGDVVGLCMERSVDLVVGFLGVMKAGAAYLPLDPGYPSERIALMLEDAAVRVLITNSALRHRIGTPESVSVLDVDAARDALETAPAESPGVTARPDDPAYVVYTSGSTGVPKGVVVPHRAVVRLVKETDYVQLTPADVIPHLSNTSFDAATFELWGALLNGGKLVIVDTEMILSPQLFAEELRRHRITTLFVTTAFFNLLAREVPGAFAHVRSVLFGGEKCDPKWVRSVLESGPPERLLHVYGPTETTTFATWYEAKEICEDAATVPIGRPIANTRAYVLDEFLNPVPIGVIGELYLGGVGVSLGYLHKPDLTSERFVADPFSETCGERLYRTGDFVRWRGDGVLEFIGRSDGQVKIRGFRVELGEIETALQRHPAIDACAASVYEPDPGNRQLAAHVVTRGEISPADLRAYLKAQLPVHAVPAYVVRVGELPLTPNGKVDRSSLPPPDPENLSAEQFEAPRTALEARLVTLWEQILHRRPIGTKDNFFELGGHSLLAVQLIAAIERIFHRRLPLSALFSAPTVSDMARLISEQNPEISWGALTAIQTRGTAPPLFCIHGVAGHVFKYARLAKYLDPGQPLYAIQGLGFDGSSIPFQRIEEMAALYVEEIRSVQRDGPYLLASNCVGSLIALEIARQLSDGGEDVPLLVFFDPPGPNMHERLRDGFRQVRHRRVRRCFAARLLLLAGRPVPHRLRDAYVSTTNKRLLSRYLPQPFPGRITIIRTRRTDSGLLHRGWDRIADAGVDVFEIDGPHDLLQEPYVGELAAHLQSCIRRATATAPAIQPEGDGACAEHWRRPPQSESILPNP